MVEIVDILTVLGIGSIFATVVGGVLKYIFDKENEKLKYHLLISEKMIDKLHDYIKQYYAQLFIQAKWLSYYLLKIRESKALAGRTEDRYIKYSFFFLAKFLSSEYTLNEKIGGIILKNLEAEDQIIFLLHSFDVKVNLDVREAAILRKNLEPAHDGTGVNVNEFLDKLKTSEELADAYDKFKGTVSDEETLKDLLDLLYAFTAIFIYQINLIYEPWYKSKPKQPIKALQTFKKFWNLMLQSRVNEKTKQ